METTRCFEPAPEGSSLAACSLPAGHEGQHRAHFAHDPEGAFIEWSNEDCTTLRARAELEQVKRERDEARAEVERLRDRLQTAVDEQVSPHETLPAEELITLLEHSLAEGRHERERLRGALEEALQMLEGQSQRPSRIARIRAALAGEGKVPDRAHTVDVDLCTVHAVDMQPAPVDEHQVNKTRMLRFRLRQGEPLYICLTQGRQIVIKVDPRYGGAGEEPTHTPTPEKASQP